MLTTSDAVRGLDFPGVTGVFDLSDGEGSNEAYVHLCGRVGRVGQVGRKFGGNGGVATTIVEEGEEKSGKLAESLGFEWEEVEFPGGSITDVVNDKGDVEQFRRLLEDYANLL